MSPKRSESSSRLVAWLEEHELTPAAFAARIAANRSQIYRLTTGERGPSIDLAYRIQEATGGVVLASGWARDRRHPRKGRRPAPRRAAAREVHGPTLAR